MSTLVDTGSFGAVGVVEGVAGGVAYFVEAWVTHFAGGSGCVSFVLFAVGDGVDVFAVLLDLEVEGVVGAGPTGVVRVLVDSVVELAIGDVVGLGAGAAVGEEILVLALSTSRDGYEDLAVRDTPCFALFVVEEVVVVADFALEVLRGTSDLGVFEAVADGREAFQAIG